ncbi:MAG: hypothetical protein ACI4RA_02915 [Kiritimatiellia bacterium]
MSEQISSISRIVNKAVALAQEENRRKGIPNVYCLNGTIVWQLPDGSVTTTKPD